LENTGAAMTHADSVHKGLTHTVTFIISIIMTHCMTELKAAIFRRKADAPERPKFDLSIEVTKNSFGGIIEKDKKGKYKIFHSTLLQRYDFDSKLLEVIT